MANAPRIVITGMGWVTPLGHDIATVWGRLMRSETGMSPIEKSAFWPIS